MVDEAFKLYLNRYSNKIVCINPKYITDSDTKLCRYKLLTNKEASILRLSGAGITERARGYLNDNNK